MFLQRFAVLGVLAVLPAVAQVYNAPASPQADVKAPSRRHGLPKDVRVRPDGSITNTFWSGYLVNGPDGSVTDVKGSWTVPAVTCADSATTYSSFWVGIDGYPSTTVEQAGTASDCVNGTPSYYAWFEFYPLAQVVIPDFPVQPGDQMSA
jgi:hypothetical protein